jgi:predicted AAA+ superfamily ATPase
MPHPRKRVALNTIRKRLHFFPILAVQGARQTGKSFLVRNLLQTFLPSARYETLDDESTLSVASESARTFLVQHADASPLIIDEAQKAPPLFNALKLMVDQKRTPGKYLILGSTEFSRQALIREALTGRMGRVRLFPMCLKEAADGAKPTQKDVLKYLTHGGLPGICFTRDEQHRDALLQDWIDLTCYRDLQQFKKLKLDGSLAAKILRLTATLHEPTRPEIASALRVNPKKVQTHLNALVELFVLTRLDPHPSGTGKSIYLPFDCGVAAYLGASRERCLHVWLLNERLVFDASFHSRRSQFYYYRSTGKKWIHLVEEVVEKKSAGLRATQIITHEAIKKPDSELMKAFLAKNSEAQGSICAPVVSNLKLNEVEYAPWETFAARW